MVITQISLIFFFLVNLVVAFYATGNIATMDEYVKANKKLGNGVLIATLTVTLLDAGNIGLRVGYEIGLLSMRNPILLSLAALILGNCVFPRITQFTNEYTIAELMYTFFGSFARYFTTIVAFFFCFLALVSQLVAWSNLSSLVGVSPVAMIVFMGFFVAIYTLLGGIRAVAKTDILQLGVVIVCSVFFFVIIFYRFGGIQKIVSAVPKNSRYDTLLTYPNITGMMLSAFFFSFFPTLLISPPVVQRLLMTDDKNKIRKMFTSFAIFYIIFRSLMLVISFTRFSIPNSLPSVKGVPIGDVVTMLCSSPLCQLLFLMIACAVIMSTMDSFLNSVSIMLVNDLVKPAFKLKHNNQVKYIKFFSLLIGIATIVIAMMAKKLYFLSLLNYGSVCISSVTIPFLFALYGLKGSKKSFLACVTSFWMTMLIPFLGVKFGVTFFTKIVEFIINAIGLAKVFSGGYTNMLIVRAIWYPAIVVSTVAFLVTHYIEHGGFLLVKRVKNLWVLEEKHTLKPFFRWFLAPVQWANEKVNKIGEESFLFAMLVICYYMLPYWADPSATSLNYYGLYLLRILAIFVAFGALAGQKIWIHILKPYYNLYYQWSVFFCVTFVNTLTTVADLNNPIIPFYLAFGILGTAYLVDWNTFWLFQSLALLSSLLIHKVIAGTFVAAVQSEYVLPLFTSIGLSIGIAFLFINRNRNHMLALKATNEDLEKEKENILVSITESADQLSQAIKKDSMMMKELQKNFGVMKLKVGDTEEIRAINSALQYFYKKSEDAKRHLRMHVRRIPIDDLFNHAWHDLKNRGLNPSDYNIVLARQDSITTIVGDLYYLTTLLVAATEYGVQHSRKNALKIVVNEAYIQYDLPDIYNKEPKKALKIVVTNQADVPSNKEVYTPDKGEEEQNHQIPEELKNNVRIIKAHLGFFAFSKSAGHMTQTYVLPLNLKVLKPRIEAFVYEELFDEVAIDEPEDVSFLDKVAQKNLEDHKIKLAMRVAKHYHFLQKRKSGEPYYSHPLSVATILLDYTDDPSIIVAGLLHDTIEDTPYEKSQMEAMFGERVTRMVQEVTHLYSREGGPKIKLDKQETLDLLIQHGNHDSLLIKLADRLHNMRTIPPQSSMQKRKRLAEETQRVLIPIAHKLKLFAIEEELKQRVEELLSE